MVMFLVECRILSLCAGYMLFHLQVGTQSYSVMPEWLLGEVRMEACALQVRPAAADRGHPQREEHMEMCCAGVSGGQQGHESSVLSVGSSVFDILFHLRR